MLPIDWILFIFVTLLGACIGSFLNVVIYRMPAGKSIVSPPSACPKCDYQLKWYDNIPILSWVCLKAKCRSCDTPISAQYPLIELITALLFGGWYLIAYATDLHPALSELGVQQTWPMLVVYLFFLGGLLAATLIDARHYIIPLEIMWLITGVALVGAVVNCLLVDTPYVVVILEGFYLAVPYVPEDWIMTGFGGVAGVLIANLLLKFGVIPRSFDDPESEPAEHEADDPEAFLDHPHPRREVLKELLFLLPIVMGMGVGSMVTVSYGPDDSLALLAFGGVCIGYLAGGAVVWAIRILGTLGFGKEAMGLGDVHLMAAVGAVAGWEVAVLAFFIAPFSGLAWAAVSAGVGAILNRQVRIIPYGPHLAVASVGVLIFKYPLLEMLGPALGQS